MFGSDIIDAAIGLFLVYFLFSLLCSALNEWIIGHMQGLRAKTLETAIERLLACPNLKQEFYDLPLIKSLAGNEQSKPSYISNATFVDALLTLVKNKAKAADSNLKDDVLDEAAKDLSKLLPLVRDKLKGVPVQPILLSLLNSAKDIDAAHKKFEAWFDEGMDRATGWYRKHVQISTAVLAVGLAAVFNVDTFAIARELLSNSRLRAVLVASAEETVKRAAVSNAIPDASNLEAVQKKIKSLELPLGWPTRTNVVDVPSKGAEMNTTLLRPEETWPMKIGGLLVTAGALSLGAPFWFDLLGKIINLRAAGKKPEETKKNRAIHKP